MEHKKDEGELVRTADGQFIEGKSGNPKGRPKGSKNKITLLKLQAEEEFRMGNTDRIQIVLDLILQAAMDGDAQARKMVWDANMSKAALAEDKNAGQKQQITVHRQVINHNPPEDKSDE
jgi:hypothetical protein